MAADVGGDGGELGSGESGGGLTAGPLESPDGEAVEPGGVATVEAEVELEESTGTG
ncbi:MAG: hypothetical protein AB7F86_04240 [Bdellovibrionales bacterium]